MATLRSAALLLFAAIAPSTSLSLPKLQERQTLVTPNPLPGQWRYMGCYTDSGTRTLQGAGFTSGTAMTDEACIAYCQGKNMYWAGTEYSGECYCGNSLQGGNGLAANQADCNMACSGNSSEACGGPNRLTMFGNGPNPPSQPVVNPGVNGWTGLGCYNDTTNGLRTLTTPMGVTGGASNMSVLNCVTACQGYTFAGVEYGGECYCGNALMNGGGPAVDGNLQCTMTCNGNSSEICGGPGRLDAYIWNSNNITGQTTSSSASSQASSTSSSKASSASSSAASTTSGASSTGTKTSSSSSSSKASSTSSSSSKTSSTSSSSSKASSTSSSSKVSSTSSSSKVSSTSSSTKASSTSSTSSKASSSTSTNSPISTAAPICPAANGTQYQDPNGAVWLVYCNMDTVAGNLNVANNPVYVSSLAACIATCEANTGCIDVSWVAGAPGPCYLKSSVGAYLQDTGVDNAKQLSGPTGVISSSASSTISSSVSTTKSSTSSAASSSSTGGLGTAHSLPAGWSYRGCWVDNVHGRILNAATETEDNMTIEMCVAFCAGKGYSIAGTQFGTQCFCDNEIIEGGTQAPDTDCSTPCAGDNTEICGNGNRNSVYSNVTGAMTVLQPPFPQTTGLPGSWSYAGCLLDNFNGVRVFPYMIEYPGTATPSLCLSTCQAYGFPVAGIEYAYQCFCGDMSDVTFAQAQGGGQIEPDSQCTLTCPGNPQYICGDGNRLTFYNWTGPPLYTWHKPTGTDMGQYSLLIGGVVVPLMTSANINGKITFVEKYGTSEFANSTGAYELDPTQVNNFNSAWRTMFGLKTDVFCSAGLILPDRAGRQLNIGGWSGESTYGVRLYWPDGAPGQTSVNNWQENFNEVALQVGRWYPSAMTMTNGSILVVGGEIGSNSAPQPSLEILPYTGTAPLFQQWLQDTDPNNLYPFLAVLPSGGILVIYYNLARILDPVTFQTRTILPNLPGAVNNPTAGRNYPLEGTMILMPQHAPYSDPLTVMVCGGSTIGGGDAVDNCVSLQPDNPGQWTIERMPSKRVMVCVAALPDGTYLLANGAHQGVAGFGLATNPNLNAVLYDPSQPINSRMSIMANTSVARLYHSEAILMQDGRVLISGSDPEDGTHPEEFRVEVFTPPYLLKGNTQPTFTIANKDWAYGGTYTVNVQLFQGTTSTVKFSLMGGVVSTHGNSMGQRTLFPAFTCNGNACTITAPPNANIAPPGWYQLFTLDGPTPSHSQYVRIGGDPAGLGNWPNFPDFQPLPGVGPI